MGNSNPSSTRCGWQLAHHGTHQETRRKASAPNASELRRRGSLALTGMDRSRCSTRTGTSGLESTDGGEPPVKMLSLSPQQREFLIWLSEVQDGPDEWIGNQSARTPYFTLQTPNLDSSPQS